MLKADLEKLEMAKKEINNVSEKAERAMKKLDSIIRDLNKLEQEEETEANNI